MKYQCECTYCGHQWRQVFWKRPEAIICLKCSDLGVKVSELKDVFGYDVPDPNKPKK